MISIFLFNYRTYTYDILVEDFSDTFILVYTGDISPHVFAEMITKGKSAEELENYIMDHYVIEDYFNTHYIIIMHVPNTVNGKIKSFVINDKKISISFMEIDKRKYFNSPLDYGDILAYEVQGEYKGQTINVNTTVFQKYTGSIDNNSYIYKDGITYKELKDELHVIRYMGDEETVTIPNQVMGMPVTKICKWSFDRNDTMKTLILPQTIKEIEDYSIYRCKALSQILVDDKNKFFKDYENVLFTKALDELVIYPPGATSETYTIPKSVTIIRNTAFLQFYYLKHLVLHELIIQMPIPGSIGAIRDYQISFSVKQGTYAEFYAIENEFPYDYIE